MTDGDMPMWKGLFEWSMKFQDSTHDGSTQARAMSDEDKKWLEDALKSAMVDLSERMKDITTALDSSATDGGNSIEEKERMLDELLDLVESIDQAKDLSTIGGLKPLLHVLDSGIRSLQWRAGEIIGTCAQNNEEVQASFIREGVMPAIWTLLDIDDATCRLKGLFAVSCMIRGCHEAQEWFSMHDGVNTLLSFLENRDSNNERIQRKCLQILGYVVEHSPRDREIVCSQGEKAVHLLSTIIRESDDVDLRTAALSLGKSLSKHVDGFEVLKHSEEFIALLQVIMCRADLTPEEDWGAAEDEVHVAKEVYTRLLRDWPEEGVADEEALTGERGQDHGSVALLLPPPQ